MQLWGNNGKVYLTLNSFARIARRGYNQNTGVWITFDERIHLTKRYHTLYWRWAGPVTYPAAPLSWLATPLVLACGAVSAGPALGIGFAVRLALTLLLVGPLWGSIWWAIRETDWRKALQGPKRRPADPPVLPYTVRGSIAYNVAIWCARVVAWWRVQGVRVGANVTTVALGLLFALALAWHLGPPLVWLTLALAGLAVMSEAMGERGQVAVAGPLVLVWWAGLATYGGSNPVSLGVSLLYALSFCAIQWPEAGGWTRALPQMLVVALLVAIRMPLAALVVGLLLIPQLLWEPVRQGDGGVGDYAARVQGYLALGMAMAALAVAG